MVDMNSSVVQLGAKLVGELDHRYFDQAWELFCERASFSDKKSMELALEIFKHGFDAGLLAGIISTTDAVRNKGN